MSMFGRKEKGPSPLDLQRAMLKEAADKIAAAAPTAAKFEGCGNDPAGNNDMILIGVTPFGITQVAIRITLPQLLLLCGQTLNSLSQVMQQGANAAKQLEEKQGGAT